LSLSCKKNKDELINYDSNGNPIITKKYKLDFITEVLDDTSNINVRGYKNPYLFITSIATKHHIPIKLNDSLRFLKQIEYLSLHLETKDSLFIKNQLSNKIGIERIKKLGFKTVNWDNLINYHFDDEDKNIEYLVSEDSISKIENLMKKDGILYLSGPIFNEKLNLAYIEVDHGVTGKSILFEKKSDDWKTKAVINSWIR
jgi:hypothetical protein